MERVEATVHGIVQGVFFRHFTRLRAQALDVSGTVENRPDGSVHVIAEGPRDTLESLLQWLHQGPDLAVVRQVKVCWGQATSSFEGFRILR